jgi:hypothetical protein
VRLVFEDQGWAGQVAGVVCDRYASMAEVMRLLHVAGSARNVLAAFFLGEVDKVIGPVSVVVMGTPGEALPAGEVAPYPSVNLPAAGGVVSGAGKLRQDLAFQGRRSWVSQVSVVWLAWRKGCGSVLAACGREGRSF